MESVNGYTQGRTVNQRGNRALTESHGLQILVTDPQAVKWIALADILLDRVPFYFSLFARLQDGRPVEITLTDLRHSLFAIDDVMTIV